MTGKGKQKRIKRKRHQINFETKLMILNKYKEGKGVAAIGRDFGLAPSTVSSIVRDSARLLKHINTATSLKSTVICKRWDEPIQDMEKLLIDWIDDQSQQGVSLCITDIKNKAKSFFDSVKSKYPESSQTFMASNGWYYRFKQRVRFNDSEMVNENADDHVEKSDEYFGCLKQVIDDGNFLPQQVFIADEVDLYWNRIPYNLDPLSKELVKKDKCRKDRSTLLLSTNASGCCKLKPMLVCRGNTLRFCANLDMDSLPVYFRSNPKIWVDKHLFKDWLTNCFVPEVEKYCHENVIPFNILLVIDTAPGHPAGSNNFHPNIKVFYLPSNTSLQIHPMSKEMFLNFKAHYFKKLLMQAVATMDSFESTKDFQESYNLYQAIPNISQAWNDVSQNCISKTWSGIFSQYVSNSHEEEETFIELTEKIFKLAAKLGINISENDIKEAIDFCENDSPNKHCMKIEVSKLKKLENSDSSNSDDKEDSTRCFIAEKMNLAFCQIKEGISKLEKMDPDVSRFLKFQKKMENALDSYRKIYEQLKEPENFVESYEITIKEEILD